MNMKIRTIVFLALSNVVIVVAVSGLSLAREGSKSWVGTISDSECGAKHAKVGRVHPLDAGVGGALI